MPERRLNPARLSHVCYIIASYFFLVVLMAVLKAETVLALPGVFLFDRFHLASLYIPVLILVGGILIKSGRLPRRTMLLLWISPIPFLTSAVLFQVLAGQTHVMAPRVLIDAFGRFPAFALFFLLLAMEIAGIVKLASLYTDPADSLFTTEELKLRIGEILGYLGLGENVEDENALSNFLQEFDISNEILFDRVYMDNAYQYVLRADYFHDEYMYLIRDFLSVTPFGDIAEEINDQYSSMIDAINGWSYDDIYEFRVDQSCSFVSGDLKCTLDEFVGNKRQGHINYEDPYSNNSDILDVDSYYGNVSMVSERLMREDNTKPKVMFNVSDSYIKVFYNDTYVSNTELISAFQPYGIDNNIPFIDNMSSIYVINGVDENNSNNQAVYFYIYDAAGNKSLYAVRYVRVENYTPPPPPPPPPPPICKNGICMW